MPPGTLLLAASLLLAPDARAEPASPKGALSDEALQRQMEDARRQLREAMEKMRSLHQDRCPGGHRFHLRLAPRLGVVLKGPAEEGGSARGLSVQAVTPGGPASKAGIRAGDVLTAIEGESLARKGEDALGEGRRAIVDRLKQLTLGQKVVLELLRDNQPWRLEVLLDDDAFHAPPWGPFDFPPMPDIPELRHGAGLRMFGPRGPFRDLGLATLNPDLGQYFGAQEGVLVLRATPEAAPLKSGDVILKVGSTAATSPSEVVRQLRAYGPNETVTVELLRHRARQTVSFKIPADAADGGWGR